MCCVGPDTPASAPPAPLSATTCPSSKTGSCSDPWLLIVSVRRFDGTGGSDPPRTHSHRAGRAFHDTPASPHGGPRVIGTRLGHEWEARWPSRRSYEPRRRGATRAFARSLRAAGGIRTAHTRNRSPCSRYPCGAIAEGRDSLGVIACWRNVLACARSVESELPALRRQINRAIVVTGGIEPPTRRSPDKQFS